MGGSTCGNHKDIRLWTNHLFVITRQQNIFRPEEKAGIVRLPEIAIAQRSYFYSATPLPVPECAEMRAGFITQRVVFERPGDAPTANDGDFRRAHGAQRAERQDYRR